MWPFTRKQKDLKTLARIGEADDRWILAEASDDGAPLIIRANSSAKGWVGHAGLPIKVGFAIPLNNPHEGGLPDPEENQQLSEVEDLIVREVGKRAKGIHVLALTNGIMKEFIFYLEPGANVQKIHETIEKRVTTHEVQCIAMEEPDWETYLQFAPD